MNSTYAQKSSTVQKAADTKAASVLDSSAQSESLQRKADMANNVTQRAEAPRPNNTGMPDNLKAGIESLSGFSMDDVRVHYNSSKPATVQALAYTQGTDIHVAPGQEKCLPHEAWHVAQQMAGRVFPTTNINGMPVNDNATLEHEADVMGEKAVQCKNDLCTVFENNSFHPKISNVKQFVVQRDEDGSVFDVGKIHSFLNESFGVECDEADAKRVQTLFEDIRQVDLQFLATSALSYEEDDSSYEATQKANQSTGSVESADEKEEAELENQNFKKMVEAKIIYLEQMKGKVKEAQSRLFYEFNLAVGNRERFAVKKKLDNNDRYYSELCFQVDLLRKALISTEKVPTGTLFNQNVLLTSGVDVDCYMSIVGPGNGMFKDITQVDEKNVTPGEQIQTGVASPESANKRSIHVSGEQLQIGVASPVRQFSWYLKYLIDQAAAVNNPPLIRSFQMSQESFKKWQNKAISEKMGGDGYNPMNEDFKVPNQFGIPSISALLQELGIFESSLTTYVDLGVVSKESALLKNSGNILGIDEFKRKIGFGRYKKGCFVPTKVHLFNESDTAFFSVTENKAELYTANKLREKYSEYSQLMLIIEFDFGTENHVENLLNCLKCKKPEISDKEKKIKKLIELNNCAPLVTINEKDGSIDVERKYGLRYLQKSNNTSLLNIIRRELQEATPKQLDALKANSGINNELEVLGIKKDDDFRVTLNNALKAQNGDSVHIDALCFKILRVLEKNKKGNVENKKCEDLSFLDEFLINKKGEIKEKLDELLIGKRTKREKIEKINTEVAGKLEVLKENLKSLEPLRPKKDVLKKKSSVEENISKIDVGKLGCKIQEVTEVDYEVSLLNEKLRTQMEKKAEFKSGKEFNGISNAIKETVKKIKALLTQLKDSDKKEYEKIVSCYGKRYEEFISCKDEFDEKVLKQIISPAKERDKEIISCWRLLKEKGNFETVLEGISEESLTKIKELVEIENKFDDLRKEIALLDAEIGDVEDAVKYLEKREKLADSSVTVIFDAIEELTFAKRKQGRLFDQLNPEPDKVDEVNIPYDKFASFHRYVPKEEKPKEVIPFIGGASGTTRDISKYLLSKGRFDKKEKEYYEFQLLNASFMSAYGYHSFVEAIYRAAVEWCNYNGDGDSSISKNIIECVINADGSLDVGEEIKKKIQEGCGISCLENV